ncbi:short-chain dehydrogenase domain-containing protein (plasmid) [Rhizobium sp. NXC24]|nr:short-chain dehydrogenase domain-containing protein [Rhizobium sp. NXC24]
MTKQIALITGASRGLGRSMALHLAKRGVAIIGTYRSVAAEADTLRQEIEALGGQAAMIALDVSNSASFPAFAETVAETLKTRFGRQQFDFLVNNAGHGLYALLTDATEEQFDSLIDTHLRGPVFLTQKLLPLIADGGRILNVSSGFVRVTMAGYGLYAAAKAAIQTLTKFMAVELGARQIRVNTIAPGAIATAAWSATMRTSTLMSPGPSRLAVSASPTTSAARSRPSCPKTWAGRTAPPSTSRAARRSDRRAAPPSGIAVTPRGHHARP